MPDRIKGITIEIDGDTTKLSKALSRVNSDVRKSQNELRDINKLLKLDPGNTTLLQQKYKALADSIDSTKTRLQTLREAEKQMTQSGDVGTQQWDALQREIVETEQKLKSLNTEMDKFGSVSAQKVAAAGEKVKDVGQSIEGAGQKMLPVTAALTAVGTAGVMSFAEVDKTMQLTNKTMGNSEKEAESLEKAMKSAAAGSVYGMKEAANASLNFARAGLDAKQSAAALAPAMNLAAGEGGNLNTVSAGLVGTINGFHDSFDEAGHYADVFAAACNNSALDVDSLSNSMSVAAPVFSAAGYKVNDAALYMGVMANNGIDANVAANSLKTGLARLVSPAKEGATMMDKLNISVKNSDGTMKSTIQIQKELHDAFAQLSESEQIAAASAIFGKNQMAPWLALINTAPSDVEKLNASLEECGGTTEEMANAMMNGFGGSLEKLKSSIDVLVYSIGEALAPTVQQVANFIQALVDAFNSLSPWQQELIVKIGLILALAGPLLIIVGNIIQAVGTIMTLAPAVVGLIGGITTAVTTIGGALQALWVIMLANPIVLIIAAIAALVAAFVYFWNTSEEFRQFWINLWDNIKAAFQSFLDAAKGIFDSLVSAAANAWGNIKTTTSDMVEGAKNAAISGFENMRNTASDALSALRSTAQTVWDGIVSLVSGAVERLKAMMNFEWSLPHIKIPHFSISGFFSLDPPSIPHISMDWYKKAMDGGMILSSPTIFGMAGGRLLGGGEAGPEAVVGVESLRAMISDAVASTAAYGGDIIIPVYIGQRKIDTIVVDAITRSNYRSGGR